jgi:hypothetical protein
MAAFLHVRLAGFQEQPLVVKMLYDIRGQDGIKLLIQLERFRWLASNIKAQHHHLPDAFLVVVYALQSFALQGKCPVKAEIIANTTHMKD